MILKQRRQEIDYTEDQINALNEIDSFLKKSYSYDIHKNTFKLAGYAGTGKTTIIENIYTYARDVLHYGVFISAPTNAAIKVLRQKSENWLAGLIDYKNTFRTLHSLLYGEPDEDGNWNPKSQLTKGQLLIIDESSMIDTFVNNDINKQFAVHGAKVIKIGDGFQLEPVGDDPKVLKNPHYEMKDVKRHDGLILDYVTKLRETKKTYIPNKSKNEVQILPIENLGVKWLDSIKDSNDNIFITSKNKTRVHLNNLARTHKFGDDADILKATDQIIVISNSTSFKNSETFVVDKVLEYKPIDIYSQKKESFGDCYYCKIMINGIYDNFDMFLFPNTLRSSIYHPEINIHSIPFDLEHLIDRKVYKRPILSRNVLLTTYGYAITAHKSQGSQWNNVYIHNDHWGDNPRWLYTAASRATKFLMMSDNSSDNKLTWSEIINNGK